LASSQGQASKAASVIERHLYDEGKNTSTSAAESTQTERMTIAGQIAEVAQRSKLTKTSLSSMAATFWASRSIHNFTGRGVFHGRRPTV
jgi:hypothetical protein